VHLSFGPKFTYLQCKVWTLDVLGKIAEHFFSTSKHSSMAEFVGGICYQAQ